MRPGFITPGGIGYGAKFGAVFDGSNDYMDKSGSILSNYKIGLLSFWMNKVAGATTFERLLVANMSAIGVEALSIDRISSGGTKSIQIILNNDATAGTLAARKYTMTSFENSAWHHFMLSWNSSSITPQFVVDGTLTTGSFVSTILPGYSGGVIDSNTIGAYAGGGAGLLNASIAEYVLKTGTYYDISDPTFVKKFRSASGRPVFLGADGSRPFGSTPELYFKGEGTGFNVNSGSAGNFTTTGAFTTPTTGPSS